MPRREEEEEFEFLGTVITSENRKKTFSSKYINYLVHCAKLEINLNSNMYIKSQKNILLTDQIYIRSR